MGSQLSCWEWWSWSAKLAGSCQVHLGGSGEGCKQLSFTGKMVSEALPP